MKSKILLVAGLGMLVGFFAVPQQAVAQDGPGSRVVVVTTWDVPFGERSTFMPFFRDRFLVNSQLNENVLAMRVLFHQYGSNADQIVWVREYADLAAVGAPCGQPCQDWNEANPWPQEGDDGYEAFQEGVDSFTKYYSRHSDEIYRAPMAMAIVEGEALGRIGPAPADDE